MRRRPLVLAVLGPTASGKSALGLSLAERHGGEIINCDSTAVYRGFDIGTDKTPDEERRGIPHHLIDIADPTEPYTAAQFARDAAAAIRDMHQRQVLPILVGGTGFYFRALTRGLFPGPGANDVLRSRLERIAERRGPERLHRILARVDPPSARRIMPRDARRLVRALEVYFETGRPLTEHFADTRSLIEDCEVVGLALAMGREAIAARVLRRVDRQFERGIVGEVRGLLASGVPESARPFGGLVYRQVLEMLRGERDEAATRSLIASENRHYARRQLIWFRKEPTLIWFDGPGESPETLNRVDARLARGPGGDVRRPPLMAQATESRSSSPSAQPNMQDVFLNHARRNHVDVVIHMMDGRQLAARIKNFDKFAIVIDGEGGDQLIFKHAIASIESTQTIANYVASSQS